MIGPNAVLQYLPILDEVFGEDSRNALLEKAEIFTIPDGNAMIPVSDARRLQFEIRQHAPVLARGLATRAGAATADYILANRIPRPAQAVLRLLPTRWAGPALSRAIAAHAWTFVGSGRFQVRSPWVFEIEDNPLIGDDEIGTDASCHWHAAVFERLYQVLIDPRIKCTETFCCAQPDHRICRFELTR